MLVSNIGLSINTHFCRGRAVKTSFTLGLHNPDCGMAMMEQGCDAEPTSNDTQVKAKPCCENRHQILQLDENADIKSSTVNTNPVFFVAFVHAFVQALIFADQKLIHNTDYSPPIPDKDIQVLFQTFLI